MLGITKMIQKPTGGELRKGFAIGAALFVPWLVAIYFDHGQGALSWIVRGFNLLLSVPCFHEYSREIISRGRRP
jgi:hypothetical protein